MNAIDHPQSDATAAPLAIIGIGCLFPKADGLGAYWANIKNRVDCITDVPPTHWRPDDYLDADPKAPDRVYAARGGFLDPVQFNPGAFGIAPSNLEATDTSQLLGLVAAQRALEDAGYWVERGARSATTRALRAPRSALARWMAAASACCSASRGRWNWSSH